VVDYLPGKYKALSSNSILQGKKRGKEGKGRKKENVFL
jgi:hypothetical protein